MTLDEFVARYTGQGIDFDGKYSFQCMDVIEQYNKDVVGAPRLYGNAIDLLKNPQPNWYDLFSNSLTYVPPRGAIAVWNNKAGNGLGHCAIILEANVMSFKCLEQDGITNSKCRVATYYYRNVQSFLVAKVQVAPKVQPVASMDLTEYKSRVHQVIQSCVERLNSL